MKLVIEKIYCLYCPEVRGIGKVGIAGNVEARRKQIECDVQRKFGDHVRVKCLLKIPILTSAYTFEQALHDALDRIYSRSSLMSGTTGHTEWFKVRNYFMCIFTYLFGLAMNWEPFCRCALAALVLFFSVLPLDFALCIILLAVAEYAIVGGVVYFVYSLLN